VKLALFSSADAAARPGVLTEEGIVDVSDLAPRASSPQRVMEAIIDNFEGELRQAFARAANERRPTPLDEVRLRPPLPRPSKVMCCIANYWEHAQREARPLNMFLKNPDAVVGPGDTIRLPDFTVP
jgi:2-keto-4-pentenoate hydratase/2-oxohepta-3-ene-1,7-dioic acid hydratase in catechol pathway